MVIHMYTLCFFQWCGFLRGQDHGVRRVGITIFLSWLTLHHQVDYIKLHSPADNGRYHTVARLWSSVLWPPQGYGTWPHKFMCLPVVLLSLLRSSSVFSGEVGLTSVVVRAIVVQPPSACDFSECSRPKAENFFFVCSVD